MRSAAAAVLAGLLSAGCSGGGKECVVAGPGCDRSPDAPGPYSVGVTTIRVSRSSESGRRELLTEVWYPARPDESGPTDRYGPNDLLTAEAQAKVGGLDESVSLYQDARRDVPLAEGGPFALLVFSHGNGGVRFQSFSLATFLASHGYVVAAPDHAGNTMSDLLLLGRLSPEAMLQSAAERPADVRAVASTLFRGTERLPASALVPDRYAVFGHSFGGSTSLMVATEGGLGYDARVVAAAPITPETQLTAAADGPELLRVPVLMIGATRDRTLDYQQHTRAGYDRAPRPKFLVAVEGAGHFSFTEICGVDVKALAERAGIRGADNVLDDGCSSEFRPAAQVNCIAARFLTAFFDRYVRGSERAAAYLEPGGSVPSEVAEAIEHLAEP